MAEDGAVPSMLPKPLCPVLRLERQNVVELLGSRWTSNIQSVLQTCDSYFYTLKYDLCLLNIHYWLREGNLSNLNVNNRPRDPKLG